MIFIYIINYMSSRLHNALRNSKNKKFIHSLISSDKELLEIEYCNKNTPLHIALRENYDEEIIKILIDEKK